MNSMNIRKNYAPAVNGKIQHLSAIECFVYSLRTIALHKNLIFFSLDIYVCFLD